MQRTFLLLAVLAAMLACAALVPMAGSAAAVTLNEALDNQTVSFSSSGIAHWFGQTDTWYYGGSAAQSGDTVPLYYSSLHSTVVGPGTLTFYWKITSEAYLQLWIDAAITDELVRESDWAKVTKFIPAGSHAITWKYKKRGVVPLDTQQYLADGAGSGLVCGWVDRVVFTPSNLTWVLPLLLN
jgi:hypothetical protein